MIGVLCGSTYGSSSAGKRRGGSGASGGYTHLRGAIDILAQFSVAAALELVVPLAITVIAAQNAQGIVILRGAGHQPPVDAITTACGGASLATAMLGSVSTCLTGPSNAILVSSGRVERHWIAAVLLGVLAILFGVFAPPGYEPFVGHASCPAQHPCRSCPAAHTSSRISDFLREHFLAGRIGCLSRDTCGYSGVEHRRAVLGPCLWNARKLSFGARCLFQEMN